MLFIVNFVKRHFSLLIVVLGAGCFFLTNLLLREHVSEEAYGVYSLVITYFSIQNLVGLGGLEQVFLRYAYPDGSNVLHVQRYQWKLQGLTILSSTALGVAIFTPYVQTFVSLSFGWIALGTLAFISMLSVYNVLRLNGDFTLSQLTLNGWKIALPLLLYAGYYWMQISIAEFLKGVILLAVCSVAFGGILIIRRIRFSYTTDVPNAELRNNMLQFSISILTFTLLLFGDRLLIENQLGLTVLGDYFYLTNFFLAPFAILQSYIGFKQLVAYKTNFSLMLMKRLNKQVLLLGVVVSLGLWVLYELVVAFSFITFSFEKYRFTLVLLLVLGISRLYLAAVGAAFEAQTNLATIRRANLLFIVFASISLVLALVVCSNLDEWIAYFILLWIMRSLVYRQLLFKQFKTPDVQ